MAGGDCTTDEYEQMHAEVSTKQCLFMIWVSLSHHMQWGLAFFQ